MNLQGQIPRSRGGVIGVLLILLGLWGGLAPFVGPYFHFGYTPDTAMHYTQGRLYFSAIPGGAALLGGLVVVLTRSRALGVLGGLLAALGGAWFIAGPQFVAIVLKKAAITTGSPLATGTFLAGNPALRGYLEEVALFAGTGLLIAALGGIAMGRFSMLAARDVDVETDADSYYPATASQPELSQYPAVAGQTSPDLYQGGPSPFQPPAPRAAPAPPFADAPSPFQDTTTSQYPPPASS
jgi:hypothetical protein